MNDPKTVPKAGRRRLSLSLASATLGGFLWLGLCAIPARGEIALGTIELLFLLAPLVTVPLGLDLILRPEATGALRWLHRLLRWCQPFLAALAAASFFLPQGLAAASLASGWTLFCFLAGLSGLMGLLQGRLRSACFDAALLLLPVGGIGLIQSRFGASPLGYTEPIVLLVAVHFHYANFPVLIFAGALGRSLEGSAAACVPRKVFPAIAWGLFSGTPLLAAGFVFFLPALRIFAAAWLLVSLVLLALLLLAQLPRIRPRTAQALLLIASGSVVASSSYAAIYAAGDLTGNHWIAIPQMARTHGILNAFGFTLCGLLGWTLVRRSEPQ